MKRILSIVLCLVMSLAIILSGCGQNYASEQNTTTNQSTEANQNSSNSTDSTDLGSLSKTLDISWTANDCKNYEADNPVEKKLEEKFNVKLDVKKIDLANAQQVNLMLASGEMPDACWLGDADRKDLYDQKSIRSIPVSMVKQYAPNFAKQYDLSPLIWKQFAVPNNSNEMYQLCGIDESVALEYYWVDCFRMDWLENLGIEIPSRMNVEKVADNVYVAESGFTIDEFTNIIDKFTNGDPDKNGKNDTIGLLCNKGVGFANIMRAFGLSPTYSMNENGKAIYYYSSEKYKAYLKYIQNLYLKGCIDKEFITLPRDMLWEKLNTGKGGYLMTSANAFQTWAQKRPPMKILSDNSNAKLLVTPGEVDANGTYGTDILGVSNAYGSLIINSKTSDEKLARIMQILDYANFGPERADFWYGTLGTDYKWSGDAFTSTPTMLSKKDIGGSGLGGAYGLGSFTSFVQDLEKVNWLSNSIFVNMEKYALGTDAIWVKNLTKPYKADITNSTNLVADTKQYNTNIQTVVTEFYANSVTGKYDIDKEWDGYLANLNAAGYDKILADLDAAPLYQDFAK